MSAVHKTKSSTKRSSGSCYQFCGSGLCVHPQTVGGEFVVSATGELDASNVQHLTDCVQFCLDRSRSFVLDFSQLNFFGTQGIKLLFEIADECDKNRIVWFVIPGREVTRLLRICDKDNRLPTAESTDTALEEISAPSRARRLLQLVTKSS